MMESPYTTKKRAESIANGILLIGLGFLSYTDTWWPGILFVVGISVALRQFLTGRKTDFLITMVTLTIILAFSIALTTPSISLSLLFTLLGVYIIGREYFLCSSAKYRGA